MNSAAKQAPVSARDLPTLEQPLNLTPTLTTHPSLKEALKVLVVWVRGRDRLNPVLRREEEAISGLAGHYGDDVILNRQDVSEVAQINGVLRSSAYDVIHFSGQRESDDLYLESSFIHQHLATLAADGLLHALASAPKSPKLVVFISCFSRQPANVLSRCAPFVIRTDRFIGNKKRVAFVKHFYAHLFATRSVTASFEQATRMLQAEGLSAEAFTLHRPELTGQGGGLYIRCLLPAHEDGIVINMNAVANKIDDLGMSREEVLHLIAWRTPIDKRLLDSSRDDALIPIGDVLLGSFSWKSQDDVACNALARLGPVPEEQVSLWRALLKSYNTLAASKYRDLQRPADPAFTQELETAVATFESYIEHNLLACSDSLVKLGFRRLLPHLARAQTECAKASDRLLIHDYRGVVLALESALTQYHTVVSGVQPPVA